MARQQIGSLKKLCSYLNRAEPETATMTEEQAKQMIKELSAMYEEARSALPVR